MVLKNWNRLKLEESSVLPSCFCFCQFLSLSGFLNFWPPLYCRVWVANQKFKSIQRSGDITTRLAIKLTHVLPQKAQNNITSQTLKFIFFYRIFSKEESNFCNNVLLGRHDVLRWKCNKVANILCRVYLLVCKFALIVEKNMFILFLWIGH